MEPRWSWSLLTCNRYDELEKHSNWVNTNWWMTLTKTNSASEWNNDWDTQQDSQSILCEVWVSLAPLLVECLTHKKGTRRFFSLSRNRECHTWRGEAVLSHNKAQRNNTIWKSRALNCSEKDLTRIKCASGCENNNKNNSSRQFFTNTAGDANYPQHISLTSGTSGAALKLVPANMQ